MKIFSIKSMSVLGVVLTIASVITASVMPTKSSQRKVEGTKTMLGTNDGLTCVPDNDSIFSCTLTLSNTTGTDADSYVNGQQTINNTSIVTIIGFEPTSVVQ